MIQKDWGTFENSVNKWKQPTHVILTKQVQSAKKTSPSKSSFNKWRFYCLKQLISIPQESLHSTQRVWTPFALLQNQVGQVSFNLGGFFPSHVPWDWNGLASCHAVKEADWQTWGGGDSWHWAAEGTGRANCWRAGTLAAGGTGVAK